MIENSRILINLDMLNIAYIILFLSITATHFVVCIFYEHCDVYFKYRLIRVSVRLGLTYQSHGSNDGILEYCLQHSIFLILHIFYFKHMKQYATMNISIRSMLLLYVSFILFKFIQCFI